MSIGDSLKNNLENIVWSLYFPHVGSLEDGEHQGVNVALPFPFMVISNYVKRGSDITHAQH